MVFRVSNNLITESYDISPLFLFISIRFDISKEKSFNATQLNAYQIRLQNCISPCTIVSLPLQAQLLRQYYRILGQVTHSLNTLQRKTQNQYINSCQSLLTYQ